MTIDEDSRNPETDPQHHAQSAILSPHIQNHRHIASSVRRFLQDCCDCLRSKAADRSNFDFTPRR